MGDKEPGQDRDELVSDFEFPQIRQRHPKQGHRGQGQNPQREHRVDGNAMDREQV
jgi:hypothetical protein